MIEHVKIGVPDKFAIIPVKLTKIVGLFFNISSSSNILLTVNVWFEGTPWKK